MNISASSKNYEDMGIGMDEIAMAWIFDKEKYIPIQKHYIEQCTPKNKSNIVIDNEDYMNPRIVKKELFTSI